MCVCVAVPTDDGRNSCVFNGARTTKSNTHNIFLPRTLRQSLSCVLIPFPCVLPGSRVEFCQWCALVRCSPCCLTFRFVPFAPRRADRCWPSAGLRGGQLAVSSHVSESEFAGARMVHIGVDAAFVGGLHRMLGYFTLPFGSGCWAAPTDQFGSIAVSSALCRFFFPKTLVYCL